MIDKKSIVFHFLNVKKGSQGDYMFKSILWDEL